MQILFEDNHLIAVNKAASDIVQSDKTGDITLIDKIKIYLKEKYNKNGNVFLGLVHRLDRPVSGVIVFAKTSKALTRMNELFRNETIDNKAENNKVEKIYWAIVENKPPKKQDLLVNYLIRNTKQNKTYITKPDTKLAKEAKLEYKLIEKHNNKSTINNIYYNISSNNNNYLLEIKLLTGRHHQIRCQLAAINCFIKGDLKYGASTPNPSGSISLHSRQISFRHPVSKEQICIIADVAPDFY